MRGACIHSSYSIANLQWPLTSPSPPGYAQPGSISWASAAARTRIGYKKRQLDEVSIYTNKRIMKKRKSGNYADRDGAVASGPITW